MSNLNKKQFATYYHATHSRNVPSILKEGLRVATPGAGNVEEDEGHPTGVYLTPDIESARDYGDSVFEVQVNPKKLGYSPENSHEYSHTDIPPDRIKLMPSED